MSKMKDIRDTMENLIKAGREALDLLEEMMELFPAVEAPGVPEVRVEAETETPEKNGDDDETKAQTTSTLNDVRTLLAEKARTGYRAEVKALLTAHGAKQLSDITDPEVLGAMLAEATRIGAD